VNQTTIVSTATGIHAGPMDLSAIWRQLTKEGKTTRLREGHCLHCGRLAQKAWEYLNKRRKPLQGAAITNITITSSSESGNVLSHV
jgi:hypothetical protein